MSRLITKQDFAILYTEVKGERDPVDIYLERRFRVRIFGIKILQYWETHKERITNFDPLLPSKRTVYFDSLSQAKIGIDMLCRTINKKNRHRSYKRLKL